MTMIYEPMVNDSADFDPMSADWSYILDDTRVTYHHPLVAVRLRQGRWPFAREDREYTVTGVRLAPDWCFYSWASEYVPVGPVGDEDSTTASATVHLGSCYAWRTTIHLDLAAGMWKVGGIRGDRDGYRRALATAGRADEFAELPERAPDGIVAEAEHKAAKLVAYLAGAGADRDRVGSVRPVTAADLYHAAKVGE